MHIFEIMSLLSVKNGYITTVHLVSLFNTNHAVFVSVGCLVVPVFCCISTHLKNEKQCEGRCCTVFYCFERSSLSVPIWDSIFSLIRSKGVWASSFCPGCWDCGLGLGGLGVRHCMQGVTFQVCVGITPPRVWYGAKGLPLSPQAPV